MKLYRAAALALAISTPTFASPIGFLIDFEKSWDFANGDVDAYYAGGPAADGTTGPNRGVSFVGISGLSNDASFTYYTGAPSPQGTAYAHTLSAADKALLNIAGSVGSALSFYYSSPSAVVGAVRAYSGLNGTGALLGSFDLAANSSANYDTWSQVAFTFNGFAQSFDFTRSSNVVLLDNISATAVPEPGTAALLVAGIFGVGLARAKRRKSVQGLTASRLKP